MKRLIATPQLSLSEALNASTKKITQFKGRSRRSEYWWTMLIVFLLNIVLTPLGGFIVEIAIIPLTFRRLHDIGKSGWWYGVYFILKFLLVVYLFAELGWLLFCLSTDRLGPEDFIAAGARYLLWIGIILVYQVVLLIFMCLDSEQGTNQYGESPKYKEVDEEEPGTATPPPPPTF